MNFHQAMQKRHEEMKEKVFQNFKVDLDGDGDSPVPPLELEKMAVEILGLIQQKKFEMAKKRNGEFSIYLLLLLHWIHIQKEQEESLPAGMKP